MKNPNVNTNAVSVKLSDADLVIMENIKIHILKVSSFYANNSDAMRAAFTMSDTYMKMMNDEKMKLAIDSYLNEK